MGLKFLPVKASRRMQFSPKFGQIKYPDQAHLSPNLQKFSPQTKLEPSVLKENRTVPIKTLHRITKRLLHKVFLNLLENSCKKIFEGDIMP